MGRKEHVEGVRPIRARGGLCGSVCRVQMKLPYSLSAHVLHSDSEPADYHDSNIMNACVRPSALFYLPFCGILHHMHVSSVTQTFETFLNKAMSNCEPLSMDYSQVNERVTFFPFYKCFSRPKVVKRSCDSEMEKVRIIHLKYVLFYFPILFLTIPQTYLATPSGILIHRTGPTALAGFQFG